MRGTLRASISHPDIRPAIPNHLKILIPIPNRTINMMMVVAFPSLIASRLLSHATSTALAKLLPLLSSSLSLSKISIFASIANHSESIIAAIPLNENA